MSKEIQCFGPENSLHTTNTDGGTQGLAKGHFPGLAVLDSSASMSKLTVHFKSIQILPCWNGEEKNKQQQFMKTHF